MSEIRAIRDLYQDYLGVHGECYYINEEKRTVTCVLVGRGEDAIKAVHKYAPGLSPVRYQDLVIRDQYVGIAKCAPEDEFDEAYGMKLARYRANRKREGEMAVVIKKFVRNLRGAADLVERKCYYEKSGKSE